MNMSKLGNILNIIQTIYVTIIMLFVFVGREFSEITHVLLVPLITNY